MTRMTIAMSQTILHLLTSVVSELTSCPAILGATKPPIDAMEFERPKRVPAKLGARSRGLFQDPTNLNPAAHSKYI